MSPLALSDPEVKNCKKANNMIRREKQHHDMVLRSLPITVMDIRLVLRTNAAFQNAHRRRCNLRHQHDLRVAAPVSCFVR